MRNVIGVLALATLVLAPLAARTHSFSRPFDGPTIIVTIPDG